MTPREGGQVLTTAEKKGPLTSGQFCFSTHFFILSKWIWFLSKLMGIEQTCHVAIIWYLIQFNVKPCARSQRQENLTSAESCRLTERLKKPKAIPKYYWVYLKKVTINRNSVTSNRCVLVELGKVDKHADYRASSRPPICHNRRSASARCLQWGPDTSTNRYNLGKL